MGNVIIYGGSFNPPHCGHAFVIKTAKEQLYKVTSSVLTEVMVMPAYVDLYGGKNLVDGDLRVAMLEATIEDYSLTNTSVCRWELDNKITSGTYKSLLGFFETLPEDDIEQNTFYYLVGSDTAQRLRTWKNSRKLTKLLNFIVVPRKTSNYWASWAHNPGHIPISTWTLRNKLIDQVSSTSIRKKLHEGTPLGKISELSPSTKNLIDNYNLYMEET